MVIINILLFEPPIILFVLLCAIFKFCIYKKYGFKKLSKTIKENKMNQSDIEHLVFMYYVFWTLIGIFILYLFTMFILYTGHWNEI